MCCLDIKCLSSEITRIMIVVPYWNRKNKRFMISKIRVVPAEGEQLVLDRPNRLHKDITVVLDIAETKPSPKPSKQSYVPGP